MVTSIPSTIYKRDTIHIATITGSVDGNNTLLTSANTTWYITVMDYNAQTVLVQQTPMAYLTPGSWAYTLPALLFAFPYHTVYFFMQEYDQNGSAGAVRLFLDQMLTDGG